MERNVLSCSKQLNIAKKILHLHMIVVCVVVLAALFLCGLFIFNCRNGMDFAVFQLEALKYNIRGYIHMQRGEFKEAEDQFKLASRMDMYRINFNTRWELANQFDQQKRYKEADREYQKALNHLNRAYAYAYYRRCEVLWELGKIDDAKEAYNKAIEVFPECRDYYPLYKFQSYPKKESLLHKIAFLDPEYEVVHQQLGYVMWVQGKDEEAEKEYYEAIKINPKYAEAYFRLGMLYLLRRKYAEAESLFQETVRLNTLQYNETRADAFFYLGEIFWMRKQYVEAESTYRRAVKCYPAHSLALTKIGILMINKKKHKEAEDYFLRAIKYSGRNSFAFFYLSCCYAEKGDSVSAFKNLQTALKYGFSNWQIMQDATCFNKYKNTKEYESHLYDVKYRWDRRDTTSYRASINFWLWQYGEIF